MIPQEELRIGNYVLDAKTGNVVMVDGIQFSGRCVVQDNDMDNGKRGIEPEPIQITLELLEKTGLRNKKKSMHSMFWHGDDISFRWVGSKLVLITDKFRVELVHLHSLQNLYFAVTGKELEVKP